ncbi:unnamed protein product [Allacma fusca]|uniref:Uncharacterized protein n=1 Tax=Allacma fusca TaxID=39272 RepID=A0A8J2J2S4_9HEXA|nr:unnamed protein product [Allacma fusca]
MLALRITSACVSVKSMTSSFNITSHNQLRRAEMDEESSSEEDRSLEQTRVFSQLLSEHFWGTVLHWVDKAVLSKTPHLLNHQWRRSLCVTSSSLSQPNENLKKVNSKPHTR